VEKAQAELGCVKYGFRFNKLGFNLLQVGLICCLEW
jgi:hypothetical protein